MTGQKSHGMTKAGFAAQRQRLSPQGRAIKSFQPKRPGCQNCQDVEYNRNTYALGVRRLAPDGTRSCTQEPTDVMIADPEVSQSSSRSLSGLSHFWWKLGLLYSDVADFTYSQPGLTPNCCSLSPRRGRQGAGNRRPSGLIATCLKQVSLLLHAMPTYRLLRPTCRRSSCQVEAWCFVKKTNSKFRPVQNDF